tara:strand:- start:425 stop:718 length:294 start_codon:yes stop_codon:yes gene_type:complete
MGIINWLENNILSCPYKKFFGLDCFGCGMQRSFLALLKGNFSECFYLYPALIPMISIFFFLTAHLIFKFKNGANILKYNLIFVVAIVIVNFILNLIY